MAALAGKPLEHAATAFSSRDLAFARALDREDDAIDKLNRKVFETTLELDDDGEDRELGLRHVLIARSWSASAITPSISPIRPRSS